MNVITNCFLSHQIWHKVSVKNRFPMSCHLVVFDAPEHKDKAGNDSKCKCVGEVSKHHWILLKSLLKVFTELFLVASHLSLGVRVVVVAINAEKTQLSVNKVKIPTKEFFLWTLPADQGINDGKRNGRQQSFVAWVFFWVEHSKARLTNGDNGHVNAWVVQC